MSNEIKHYQLVIDFDTWYPFREKCLNDIDNLVLGIKERKLLTHCGNAKTVIREVKV